MPFVEVTKMHGSKRLADMVLREGMSVAEAYRRSGVSRCENGVSTFQHSGPIPVL